MGALKPTQCFSVCLANTFAKFRNSLKNAWKFFNVIFLSAEVLKLKFSRNLMRRDSLLESLYYRP